MRNFERSWFYRRWAALSTLIWCASMVTYLAVWGPDTRLSETIANGVLMLMGSIIAAYIFGAAWDDKNRDKAVTADENPQHREPEGGGE